ncbi:HET-domain-containing protein [Ophiobolus disseminans]|uniref:HET-domain-containing protein n=1 Tax=Ophiobolus disseminans TaxID=1469910 RepID=A0A6A7AGI1_9PLEO|nr:HET-domain-containing protein [Ophiobolus disseminans]
MLLSPVSARRSPEDVEYPGKPLSPGCIRLIRLLPGSWTEPIKCELFEVSLAIAKYHALSYVWGSKNVTRQIFLERRAFPVTVNLEGALRHLRERYKEQHDGLVLWVDALCINQKDIEERTSQVQLMGTIYTQCDQVIVYLGDRLQGSADPNVPPLVITFDEKGYTQDFPPKHHSEVDVYRVFNLFRELATTLHPGSSSDLNMTMMGKDENEQSNLFEALRRMMQPPFTPWWSRIWVIQEVTMKREVFIVYGTISVPIQLLASAARTYMTHSSSCCATFFSKLPKDQAKVLDDCCSRILGIDELRTVQEIRKTEWGADDATFSERSPLLDLLRKFRDRRASDPRDKVYALLSMARKSQSRPRMVPDYSLTEAEVFCRATLECIYDVRTLSVFSIDLGRKFRDDLPSWVPDWSAPGSLTYQVRAEIAELYDACPSMGVADEKSVLRTETGTLEVKGSIFDVIHRTEEIMWGGDVVSIYRNTLSRWWTALQDVNLAGRSLKNAYYEVICAGASCEPGPKTIVRRMFPRDDPTFATWPSVSSMSPFQDIPASDTGQPKEKIGYEPEALEAYKDMLKIWRDKVVLDSWLFGDGNLKSELVMAQSCSGNVVDNKSIFRYLLAYAPYPDLQVRNFVEDLGSLREDAPWELFFECMRRQLKKDRMDIWHASVFDNSIMAATLGRRLIIGRKYIGLGPADAKVGDKLFLLVGGKTPFVLRTKNFRAKPPEYEIVGDSFIWDGMDGQIARDQGRNWRTISLV